MIDISAELSNIKTKVYSSDMRLNIANALQKLAYGIDGITKGVELTASEYSALSESEKNNGLVYYISDTGAIYKSGVAYGG